MGSPCTLRGFSGDRKLLLSGPGVQEMGSLASSSGAAPPQEKGHGRPVHSGTGQTRGSVSTGKGYRRRRRPRLLLCSVKVISGETPAGLIWIPHR